MANGTPGIPSSSPLPGWLSPVVTLTTQVGVPTVVAAVLLWFVLTRVDGNMKEIQLQEDLRTVKVAEMHAAFIKALDDQTRAYVAAIDRNIATNRELAVDLHRLLAPRERGKYDDKQDQ